MTKTETANRKAYRYFKKKMENYKTKMQPEYIIRAIYKPLEDIDSSVLQHHKVCNYYVPYYTFVTYLENSLHLVCKYIHEDVVSLPSLLIDDKDKDRCDKAIKAQPINYRRFTLEIYYDKEVK